MALSARRYSERLGFIRPSQLQAACDLFELGTLRSAEPASAGLWGQHILLSTSRGEFVLRGNPPDPGRLLKERAVAGLIHKHSSLLAPWPYQISVDVDLFGWAFAVMPLLPGAMGSTLWDAADDNARLHLSAAHGEALAKLHEATFDSPSTFDPERNAFVPTHDFVTWTQDRIDTLRAQCRDVDALSAEAERYIDQLIDSCSAALSEPFVPVLVHHDFSLANTTYTNSDGASRAYGVFDLGEALIGDGEEDLVRFLFRRKRAQREAFMASYTNVRPLRPGAGERLSLYALADLLFMWSVSKRITNWFGDASFVETAEPVIEAARTAIDQRT